MSTSKYAENRLPRGQHVIETSNVKIFRVFVNAMMELRKETETGHITVGSMPAGTGKTIIMQTYLDELDERVHTGLCAGIYIKVSPRTTGRALALDIGDALQEKLRGSNAFDLADEAAEALLRNDIEIVLADEADLLNEESFEVFRRVYDYSGVSIVLMGLPSIYRVIDRYEKFTSRSLLRIPFVPLQWEEVCGTILPNLVVPRWRFDPAQDDDVRLGQLVWGRVQPSLRKLRTLIQLSSQVAKMQGDPWVTQSHVEEALQWVAASKRQTDRPSAGEEDDRTDYEHVSEQRHDAKRKQ